MKNLQIDPCYKFLISSGHKISPKRLCEPFLIKKYPEEYQDILDYAIKIGIEDLPFNQKVYHRIYNLEKILCENCQEKIPGFLDFKRGYGKNCSSKCSNNSKNVQDKKRNSYLERYGVDNPSKSQKVIDKIQKTFENNYGDNPFKLKEFQEKIKKTNLEKYGTEQVRSNGSIYWIEKNKIDEDKFREKYNNLNIIKYSPEKWGECKIRCNECNQDYIIPKYLLTQRVNDKILICTQCNPIGSSKETYIEGFIENILIELNLDYIKKDRKFLENGKELDFLIPDKKIAIEVNGIYWHSADFVSNTYHLDKTEICLSKGIKLLHIFEDDILFRPKLVFSRLASILGKCTNRIYARNCKIKKLDIKECNEFLEENHLQGKCGSAVKIGLIHNNILISVMTFGKLRKSLGSNNIDGYWELVRFSNKNGFAIPGGASKLLKWFIDIYKPLSIETFCDRKWSPDGNFYEKIGFTFLNNTNPNYWYYQKDSYVKRHRYTFRKDLLVAQGYDPNKTEKEIMKERGFLTVYDCGNSKWKMEIRK